MLSGASVNLPVHQTFAPVRRMACSVTACANCHGNSCLNVDKSTTHEIVDIDSYREHGSDDDTADADDSCSPYWYYFDSDDWELEETVN